MGQWGPLYVQIEAEKENASARRRGHVTLIVTFLEYPCPGYF